MKRTHVRLEERSAALLEQTENKSAYIGEVVQQRWRAAQQALAWLRDEGWSPSHLRMAMDLLSTSWEQGIGGCDATAPRSALRVGMGWLDEDAQEIDERVCRALCLLAGEWWAGNAALRLQLEDPPPPKPKVQRRPQVVHP